MEYLYIIKEGTKNTYKIGRSFDPEDRMRRQQIFNSDKLKLIRSFQCLDCKVLEKRVHYHLYDKHVSGEWFELSNDDLDNCIELVLKFIIEIHQKIQKNTCKICDFKAYKNEIFQTHLVSKAHLTKVNKMNIGLIDDKLDNNDNKDNIKNKLDDKNIEIKKTGLFECTLCKYETTDRSNYTKHLRSDKHQRKSKLADNISNHQHASKITNITFKDTEVKTHTCPYCLNTYTRQSCLTKHIKICPTKNFEIQKIENNKQIEIKKIRMEIELQQLKEQLKDNNRHIKMLEDVAIYLTDTNIQSETETDID